MFLDCKRSILNLQHQHAKVAPIGRSITPSDLATHWEWPHFFPLLVIV